MDDTNGSNENFTSRECNKEGHSYKHSTELVEPEKQEEVLAEIEDFVKHAVDNRSGSFYRTRINSVDFHGDSPKHQQHSRAAEAEKHEKATRRHTRINSTQCDSLNINTNNLDHRLVVVRYFLDRPGYGLDNSACRLWFHPPPICTPKQVQDFLVAQGIILDNLLVEVYLDKFESFMLLEACMASCIEWNYADTTYRKPGTLNIRLTDMDYAHALDTEAYQQNGGNNMSPTPTKAASPTATTQQQQQHANTTPVGLFSFSIMVGLETTALMGKLIDGTVASSFVLTWGPYMFFVGGLLQILTGVFQVLRNNIYGAVAFMGFGSFWFANGTKLILETNFSSDTQEELLITPDPWGTCIRSLYILAFSLVLLKQTFVMNKLSTTLITLLCCKLATGAFAGWSVVLEWIQFGFGWTTSFFAFYVFMVEFTNQVYHREVFKVHKWSAKDSPEEVFGHAGRGLTLYSKAATLRHARYPNAAGVRSVLPTEQQQHQPSPPPQQRQ